MIGRQAPRTGILGITAEKTSYRSTAEDVSTAAVVAAQPQAGETLPTIDSRRLGLEPVEEAQAHLLGLLERPGLLDAQGVRRDLSAVIDDLNALLYGIAGTLPQVRVLNEAGGNSSAARYARSASENCCVRKSASPRL